MNVDQFRVKPGTTVNLHKLDPRSTAGFDGDKAAGERRLQQLVDRIETLQEILYAQGTQRVLVVFQAMDAGGKDGTIRVVFDGVNPQGVRVASFKKPSHAELAHDYLWRCHNEVPAAGEIVIFNRSHYEDVLVVRVHELVPEERWRRRYQHIRNFEQLLSDEGTTIVKVFLHVSKAEQAARLQARIDDPTKRWKFAQADLEERRHWDDYQNAFQDAIKETSTKHAPWYVVPADRNWFRNLVVAEVIVNILEGLKLAYPPAQDGVEGLVVM